MANIKTVAALVVGGGGGTGGYVQYQVNDAGGGGGKVSYNEALSISPGSYNVVVGTGGPANSAGNTSSFSTISSVGGQPGYTYGNGGTSGSGMGGGGRNNVGSGGGGGDSAEGQTAPSGSAAAYGGAGTANSITGSSVYYGGGGAGRSGYSPYKLGTHGAGVIGGGADSSGSSADGIVIIRYLTADFTAVDITGTGNTITDATDDSNYSVATFIVSGTITFTEAITGSSNFFNFF